MFEKVKAVVSEFVATHRRQLIVFVAGMILGALAASAFAQGSLRAVDGADSATLHRTPCANSKVLPHIPVQYKEQFKRATVVLEGKTYPACWALAPSGFVVFVYEDGDTGMLHSSLFSLVHGT